MNHYKNKSYDEKLQIAVNGMKKLILVFDSFKHAEPSDAEWNIYIDKVYHLAYMQLAESYKHDN